jgi:hypothetical protein
MLWEYSVSIFVAGNDYVAIFTQPPNKQTKELVIPIRLDKIRLFGRYPNPLIDLADTSRGQRFSVGTSRALE